jgi:hypothetical protein
MANKKERFPCDDVQKEQEPWIKKIGEKDGFNIYKTKEGHTIYQKPLPKEWYK